MRKTLVKQLEKEGKRLRKAAADYATSMEDDEMLLADGFDAAIIGVTDGLSPVTVYDYDTCIQILMERDEMTEEDAVEHMSFNVTGAYVGERTPLFVRLF